MVEVPSMLLLLVAGTAPHAVSYENKVVCPGGVGVWADMNHCLAAKDRKGFGGEVLPVCSPGKPSGRGVLGWVGGPNLCPTIPGDAYTLFVRAFFHGHQETHLRPP